MAKRNVRWTRTADIQYVGILEYWVKQNKSTTYSKKLIKIVAQRTKQIAETPLIHKKADLRILELHHLGIIAFFIRYPSKKY